ncbi:hypothetical protein ACIQNU_33710 [Streptomyces sp. NPDC091292]|uniref:hypothetical protein n=1 Tax=Streptomyces sp. NPDC091292 TaxID=3365991 RepID=UPI003820EFC0
MESFKPPEPSDSRQSPEPSEPPEPPESSESPESSETGSGQPESAEESSPGKRPRRRGRTALLIACAAVLGTVAGTCTGYLIQADRDPTPLASLSQPKVEQARGPAPEPLSAAQDRRVKTDGDLRKLLLSKPKGARYAPDLEGADKDWMSLPGYANLHERPGKAFEELLESEFRRAAVKSWKQGADQYVDIRLVQYHQLEDLQAAVAAESDQYWAEEKDGTSSETIPGTGAGMVYVHTRPTAEPGYVPFYTAQAHAWRGDVAMEIWIHDTKPISKAKIMDLAKRQMERL